MKNIISTAKPKYYQLIVTDNGLTENLEERVIGLHYRTLYPTKSNKFITLELSVEHLKKIIECFDSDDDEVIELISNASFLNSEQSIEFISSDINASCAIELVKNSSLLNFLDSIVMKIDNTPLVEIYGCKHSIDGRSALYQLEDGTCKCSICKESIDLDPSPDKIKDGTDTLINVYQNIKILDRSMSDSERRQIGRDIYKLKQIPLKYKELKDKLDSI